MPPPWLCTPLNRLNPSTIPSNPCPCCSGYSASPGPQVPKQKAEWSTTTIKPRSSCKRVPTQRQPMTSTGPTYTPMRVQQSAADPTKMRPCTPSQAKPPICEEKGFCAYCGERHRYLEYRHWQPCILQHMPPAHPQGKILPYISKEPLECQP